MLTIFVSTSPVSKLFTKAVWLPCLLCNIYNCHSLTNSSFYYKNNIFRNTQHLEDLKSQMNWDQKALEAWLEESARKDEDALTLQKYTRADEGKVKVG